MVFQKGHEGYKPKGKHQKTLEKIAYLEEEADAIRKAIQTKDRNTEEYKTLIDSLEKVLKLIALLSGDPTERNELVGVEISVQKHGSKSTL